MRILTRHSWSGLGSDLRFAVLFSVVYAVLLRPLPVADPDRVVMVYQQDRISGALREPSRVDPMVALRSE